MDRFRICLLGGFETWVGVHPITLQLPKKTAGLLAYLALRPNQACSRDRLADLLWGEGAPEQARHSLRQALLMLRRSLAEIAPALVRAEGQMLSLEAAEVDVAAFERQVSEGSAGSLEEAAALYRGEFLEDLHVNEVAFQDWVGGERERLRELAVEALARLLQHQRRSTSGGRSAARSQGWTDLRPLVRPFLPRGATADWSRRRRHAATRLGLA